MDDDTGARRQAAADRHEVDVVADGVRLPLARERIERAARHVLRRERAGATRLSLAFVTPRAIARINREHLGHAGPTDVISFPLPPAHRGARHEGDVYICPAVARAQALEHGRPVREELLRLVVHATLHVLGWEHPEDDSRTRSPMWRRQETLLAQVLAAEAEGR